MPAMPGPPRSWDIKMMNPADYTNIMKRLKEGDFNYIQGIFTAQKEGDMAGLNESEVLLARILWDHKKWFPFFRSDGTDQAMKDRVLFHLQYHLDIERRILDKDPPEVENFCKKFEKRGLTHHDAVHLTSFIYWSELSKADPINLESYKSALDSFKLTKRILRKISKTSLSAQINPELFFHKT